MINDEDQPARKLAHEVGMPLDTLSVDELNDRIGLLEGEIVRLQQSIKDKTASRTAAESVFKI